MPVNWPPVIRGVAAILPPFLAILVGFAPYDGYFEDRRIFLYLLGGLLLGVVVAILELLLLSTAQGSGALLFIAGTAATGQLAKTAAINLPRFQGDPHAVFHGGALGAGAGAMLVLAYGETYFPSVGLAGGLQLLALGGGLSLMHVATGILIGTGVAGHGLLKPVVLAIVAAAPTAGLTLEFVVSGHPFWAAASLLYGLVLVTWASRDLLPRGLTEEDRRDRRRRIRKEQREEA